MLCNLHTHTSFCDGANTPEEIVASAIEKGFSSLGFSGHGYTGFDLRYCIQDIEGYNTEIRRLKENYKKDIQIYIGIEEDMWELVKREDYDYIIGSAHYIKKEGNYYSVDSGVDYVKRCLAAFDNNPVAAAESYYQNFCSYLLKRKPEIAGHFDLVTKFDETEEGSFYLGNEDYMKLSEKYLLEAVKCGSIFEINSGAMARGYRSTPYPYENLLYILKKTDTRIIVSSDSHSCDTLDFKFDEMKAYLKDIGFKHTYVLYDNEFVKTDI